MRKFSIIATGCIIGLFSWSCGSGTQPSSSGSGAFGAQVAASGSGAEGKIAGFAFLDSSVTAQGGQAQLPPGAKIYPPGSILSGTDGCPTNQYHTDGNPVVIIDYSGRPTAGSVTITRHPATGGNFTNAPYYLDLNPGRTLQTMGPIFDNGAYDVVFAYDYNTAQGQKTSAKLVLDRSCSH